MMTMMLIFKHVILWLVSSFSFGEFASNAFCTLIQAEWNSVTKAKDKPSRLEPSKILCFLQLTSSSNLCLSDFSLPLSSHYKKLIGFIFLNVCNI